MSKYRTILPMQLLLVILAWSVSLYGQYNDYSAVPDSNHAMGKKYLNRGDFITALSYFKEAEKQFATAGKSDQLANEWNSIAVIYNILEDFPKSFDYYSRALDYYIKTGNNEMEGVVLSNLGNIYFKTGDLEKARNHYLAAVENFPETSANDRAVTYGSIANTFMRQNKFDSALVYNLEAHRLNKIAPDSTFKGRLLINSSIIYKGLGQIEKAYKCLDSAIVLYDLMKTPMLKGDVLLSKAKLLAETNHKPEALAVAKEAEQLLVNQASIAPLADCYDVISRLSAETGDYKSAWHYAGKFRYWNDSLIAMNNKSELVSLETKHNLKLKDEELELERRSKNVYRILFFLLSVLTVLLIAGVVYIVSRRKKLTAAYNMLVQKQKEISELAVKEPESEGIVTEDNSRMPDMELESRLEHLMRDEKVYITEGLTLEQVARLLGTNRTDLSNHINTYHRKHFNNYLNQFRVNEVVRRFLRGEHHTMTLEAIARAAGFSNRTSFHLAFRKETGVTPRYFVDSLDENKMAEHP